MPRMPQKETSPSRPVIVGEVVAAAVIKISAPIAKRGAGCCGGVGRGIWG